MISGSRLGLKRPSGGCVPLVLGLLVPLWVHCSSQGSITGDPGAVDAQTSSPADARIDTADAGGTDAAPVIPDAGVPDAASIADAEQGTSSQLVVLDTVFTHNTTSMAFSFFDLPPDFPSDLLAPAAYAEGTLYERLEVISKPSAKGVTYQLCFFQDQHSSDKHACVSQNGLSFTSEGVYEFDQSMTTIWQYGVIDWDRSLLDVMLVVKDAGGNPVDTRYGFDGAWDGSPDLALYYPMEVHYTAVLVPPGETFEGWP